MNKRKVLTALAAALLLLAAILAALWLWPRQAARGEELVFRAPEGLLLAQDGTLYVADSGLHTILTLADGHADQVAGHVLPQVGSVVPGAYNDGAAAQSLFNEPVAMALWLDGIVISDAGNDRLRFLSGGKVQTLAGTGEKGCEDGGVNDASFNEPRGLAVGPDGALYVADSGSGRVRRVTPGGSVETVLEGLEAPFGLCWDGGALYIADAGAHQILRWDGESLTVFAGRAQGVTAEDNAGFADGDAAEAAFCAPRAVLACDGVVYVADAGNSAVRRIRDGQVETLAAFEGTGGELWPAEPSGLALAGDTLYVADPFAGVVFALPTA